MSLRYLIDTHPATHIGVPRISSTGVDTLRALGEFDQCASGLSGHPIQLVTVDDPVAPTRRVGSGHVDLKPR